MAKSLLTLCAMAEGSVRLIVQPDRRQTPDRRTAWRGSRRSSDFEAPIGRSPHINMESSRASDETRHKERPVHC